MASPPALGAWEQLMQQQAEAYPKPSSYSPSYGTAGFRTEASLLPSTVFRCSALMAARSRLLGRTTGVMITASHNPVEDNGVKLVDPGGEMLAVSWEEHATSLAQAATAAEFASAMRGLYEAEGISRSAEARVLLAHDNRPSAQGLLEAAIAGCNVGSHDAPAAVSFGEQTTPCLHWAVMAHGRAHEGQLADAYIADLAAGFGELLTGCPPPLETQEVLVDCANGVGYAALKKLCAILEAQPAGAAFQLRPVNGGEGQLNEACGADFVQKERARPANFASAPDGSRCASIDGDADRVVYFSPTADRVELYDGDRIAVLAAKLIMGLLADLEEGKDQPALQLGVIQTAYANGSSTRYLRDVMGCQVVLTPTGVKHLHAAAHRFDIGIYFEANGHGTVLVGGNAQRRLQAIVDASPGGSAATSAAKLLALSRVMNQAVGDALSGILLVEAALRLLGMSIRDWAALYSDLPSRQLKVKVADRTLVKPDAMETRVLEPTALQPLIDGAVQSYPSGRAFVRPSGTEDVVRVYAEAGTQAAAEELAAAVAHHVSSVLSAAQG